MNYYEALTKKAISINDIDASWRNFLYDRHDNDYDKYDWWTSMSLFLRKEVEEPKMLTVSTTNLHAFMRQCGVSEDMVKTFIEENNK